MAKFILSNVKAEEKSVDFFATPISVHHINKGTELMIHAFLEDLGFEEVPSFTWSTRYVRSNYMMDEGETAWEDVWLPMWWIQVQFDKDISFDKNIDALIRSSARDHTATTPFDNEQPASCLIVVEFPSIDLCTFFAEHITELMEALDKKISVEDFIHVLGDSDEAETYQFLYHSYLHYQECAIQPTANIRICHYFEQQLCLDFGLLKIDFFQSNATFKDAILNVIDIFEGTVTWDESSIYQYS